MREESDIYRMDGAYDDASSATSSQDDELIEEMHNDDNNYIHNQHQHSSQPHPQSKQRPPPIQTEWQNSLSMEEEEEIIDVDEEVEVMVAASQQQGAQRGVTFNVPVDSSNNSSTSYSQSQSTTTMHFQNPKRYNHHNPSTATNTSNNNFTSPYPSQSLRPDRAANVILEEIVTTDDEHDQQQIQIGLQTNKTPNTHNNNNNNNPLSEMHMPEVTPAFIRRAAQGDTKQQQFESSEGGPIIPPNSLMNNNRRNTEASVVVASSESSFYGADASALDGTFVSIRDLGDDDDVPSVSNIHIGGGGGGNNSEASFPSETTSLLGARHNNCKVLPWQGGFFGSQMEKEDAKERRKLRNNRFISDLFWTVKSLFGRNSNKKHHTVPPSYDDIRGRRRRGTQHNNHPSGESFISQRSSNDAYTNSEGVLLAAHHGQQQRRCTFSMFMITILCLHFVLCGMHDLFLRYIAYRNPISYDNGNNNDNGNDDDDAQQTEEVQVSWNGEGQYTPAYWISFDGRVFNPLIGPGARTLTAFGALVPGLVLKGQGWRVFTSLFETSSLVQLLLNVWIVKTAIGGSKMTGLEWKRGTFVVVTLYLICALIGLAWSLTIEPGRLVTSSGMGIAGLLAASIIERICFPLPSKEEDDEDAVDNISSSDKNGGHHNGSGGYKEISTSSNEQFTFQPSNAEYQKKKKRRRPPSLNGSSPSLLLSLELLFSWWGAYTSLAGTALAALMGGACALLLFVGKPPPGSVDTTNISQDLLFTEETPPPPPSYRYANDDDSADTSVGTEGGHTYKTPLMRRSILADEDDEEEPPLGTRATLRKRNVNGSSSYAYAAAKTTPLNRIKGHMVSLNNTQSFSPTRVIARLIGILVCFLLTLIPASLIATGEGPSSMVTRASVLGCKPMRILYKEEDDNNVFECAGGCIPLSRERVARKKEGMKSGRCDNIGYRCWQQSGTMTLRNYEAYIGIYAMTSADGSCGDNDDNAAQEDEGGQEEYNQDNGDAANEDAAEGEAEQQNQDAANADNNGEAEGAQ